MLNFRSTQVNSYSLDERLRREVRSVIFKNSYVGISAGCLSLAGIALSHWTHDGSGLGHKWVFALFLCLLARWFAVASERRQDNFPGPLRSSVPFSIYYVASVIEGLVWGSSMFVLFPANAVEQAFLMIVLVGLAVGALAVFFGSMSLYTLYAVFILGPAFARLVTLDQGVYITLAALTPVLLITLLIIGYRMNAMFIELLLMNFKNEQLAMIEAASKQSIIDYSDKLADKTGEVERVTSQLRKVVAVLSNDLRSQLLTLCQFSRFLSEGQQSQIYDRQFVNSTIQKSAEDGRQLVEDILQVAGGESEAMHLDIRDQLCQQIVEHAMHRVQETADEKGVVVYVAVDDQRPVQADAKHIEDVLTSLIDNAVRLTPSKGSVTVQTTPTTQGLRIEVIDNGDGIDAAEMNRLFAGSDGKAGTLVFAQKILKGHKTHLEVKNNPTSGSCFSFLLSWAR